MKYAAKVHCAFKDDDLHVHCFLGLDSTISFSDFFQRFSHFLGLNSMENPILNLKNQKNFEKKLKLAEKQWKIDLKFWKVPKIFKWIFLNEIIVFLVFQDYFQWNKNFKNEKKNFSRPKNRILIFFSQISTVPLNESSFLIFQPYLFSYHLFPYQSLLSPLYFEPFSPPPPQVDDSTAPHDRDAAHPVS